LIEEIQSWRALLRWYTEDNAPRRVAIRATPSLSALRALMSLEEVTLPRADESEDFFLRALGILYMREGNLAGRHIIPITLNGKLVAYEARDFTGRFVPKTLALPTSVKIHSYLWNIDDVVSGLSIIVVEGIKDAIAVLRFGYANVVSSFGARLSPDQVNLLMLKNPPEVILAYDADEAGLLGTQEAMMNTLAWTKVSKVTLPDGEDPWDVSSAMWEACLERREEVSVESRNKKVLENLKNEFFV